MAGGLDDVSEQDSRQDPIGIRNGAMPGKELLNLTYDSVCVTNPGQVIVAGKLDVFRPLDVLSEPAPLLYINDEIPGPMHHESGNPNGREEVTNIDLAVETNELLHRSGTCRESFIAGTPIDKSLVAGDARAEEHHRDPGAPPLFHESKLVVDDLGGHPMRKIRRP